MPQHDYGWGESEWGGMPWGGFATATADEFEDAITGIVTNDGLAFLLERLVDGGPTSINGLAVGSGNTTANADDTQLDAEIARKVPDYGVIRPGDNTEHTIEIATKIEGGVHVSPGTEIREFGFFNNPDPDPTDRLIYRGTADGIIVDQNASPQFLGEFTISSGSTATITDDGVRAILDRAFWYKPKARSIAIGTDGTASSVDDTALGNEVARRPIANYSIDTSNAAEPVMTLTSDEITGGLDLPAGTTIRELGVFAHDENGNHESLVARKDIADYVIGRGENTTFDLNLTLSRV